METKIRLYIKHKLHKRFELPTDGLEEKFPSLLHAWEKQENKIIKGLETITGFHFLQNYIDVFLINPHTGSSISHPIIIGARGDNNKIIRIINHELIHKLTWDNTKGIDWHARIQKIFKTENQLAANHIMVHAILEALYTDILHKPSEIIKDIDGCQKMLDYKRAWEIVKDKGYKSIIKQLKASK